LLKHCNQPRAKQDNFLFLFNFLLSPFLLFELSRGPALAGPTAI
jgi:hypothetical protein